MILVATKGTDDVTLFEFCDIPQFRTLKDMLTTISETGSKWKWKWKRFQQKLPWIVKDRVELQM